MAAPVRTVGASFEAGRPGSNAIAVPRDGQRFPIGTVVAEDANVPPFTVPVNWAAGVKQ